MDGKGKNLVAIIVVWIAFTSEYPFTLIQAYPWHPHLILLGIMNIIMMIWMLTLNNIRLFNNKIIFLFMFQMIGFALLYLTHNDDFYLKIILRMLPIIITCAFIKNVIGLKQFSKSLIIIFSALSVLGVFAFFLCITGVLNPIDVYVNPDGRPAYNLIITLTNKVYYFGNALVIRVASYFDEPGTFAFYIIFFLLIIKIYNFDFKYETILIIGGLFTFSLAFYIIIATYFLLDKRYNRIKYYFPIAIMVIALSGIVISKRTDNPVASKIYTMTFDRFRFASSEEQFSVGDNRSKQMFMAISIFSENPIIGYGTTRAILNYPPMNTNIFAPLAFNGIFGFPILFLNVIFLLLLIHNKNNYQPLRKNIKIFALLLIMLYLQRPHVIGYFTYSITILIMNMIEEKNYDLKLGLRRNT